MQGGAIGVPRAAGADVPEAVDALEVLKRPEAFNPVVGIGPVPSALSSSESTRPSSLSSVSPEAFSSAQSFPSTLSSSESTCSSSFSSSVPPLPSPRGAIDQTESGLLPGARCW